MPDEAVKILVVDDEPSVLESFQMILKIRDYDVTTAQSVEDATTKAGQGPFDVAFVDLRLNGHEEGLDILKLLKTKKPSPEVVIVTAFASERTQANAIELGAMEYISKPFLMEEIYDLVNRALRKKRGR